MKELLLSFFIIFLLSPVQSHSAHSGKKILKKILRIVEENNEILKEEEEKPITNVDADIPVDFEPVFSTEFIENGILYSQETHYNEKTGETILTIPAHKGYSNIVEVITAKNETHSAKHITCDDSACHFNEVLDGMHYEPENFRSSFSRKTRVDPQNLEAFYHIRSNHRQLTMEEEEQLTGGMKHVSAGKQVFTSDANLTLEKPNLGFQIDGTKVGKEPEDRQGCSQKYGCAVVEHSCGYSHFKLVSTEQGGNIPYVNETTDWHIEGLSLFCSWCCSKSDIYPNNQWPLCKDFEFKFNDDDTPKPKSIQAFYTGVALTYFDEHGSYACFDDNTEYDPNCHKFGDNFGACVGPDVPCIFPPTPQP